MLKVARRWRGIVTRIATHPSPHPTLYGLQSKGVHIDALAAFLANWPRGSAA